MLTGLSTLRADFENFVKLFYDDTALHLDWTRFFKGIFQRKNEKNEYRVKVVYFHFLWHCYAFIAFERIESA